MKNAEEVRDGVFKCLSGDCSCKSHESEEDIVLKALTSYAEERVKEETELDFAKWPDIETRLNGIAHSANRGQSEKSARIVLGTLVKQVRAETLEEAAKTVEWKGKNYRLEPLDKEGKP